MQPLMAADDNRHPLIPFRASPQVQRQIEDLMAKWGENRSQTLIRCIALAHAAEHRSSLPPRTRPRRK